MMKQKSLEKEEEIYKVVLEITAEVGLAGLKMSSIAQRAGLAHGTVYIYFKNKKDLINNLYKKAKIGASTSIVNKEEIDGNFFEEIRVLWKNYFEYLINNQKETHFLRQCIESPFLEESSLVLSDILNNKLTIFFEKGKKERYIKDLDTALILSVFSGVVNEIVRKINKNELVMNNKLMEDSFDLCWNAIRR